jgi:hypothetical protein
VAGRPLQGWLEGPMQSCAAVAAEMAAKRLKVAPLTRDVSTSLVSTLSWTAVAEMLGLDAHEQVRLQWARLRPG